MRFSIFQVKRKSRKCWEQMEALQSLPITLCGALSPLTKSCPLSNSSCRQRTRGVNIPCASAWRGDKKRATAQKESLLVLPCFYCKQPSWAGKAAQINDRVGDSQRGRSKFATVTREYWDIYNPYIRWVIPRFTAALAWLISLCSFMFLLIPGIVLRLSVCHWQLFCPLPML